VVGGHDGRAGATQLISHNGAETKLPNLVNITLAPGQRIRGLDSSGGGYGDPLSRDPERVRHDVEEGWETAARAATIYGVILSGRGEDDTLAVDAAATSRQRALLAR